MKIIFVILVGGFIGIECENVYRLVGFRIYILVCVGLMFVMMIFEYIYDIYYKGYVNIDVVRFGV